MQSLLPRGGAGPCSIAHPMLAYPPNGTCLGQLDKGQAGKPAGEVRARPTLCVFTVLPCLEDRVSNLFLHPSPCSSVLGFFEEGRRKLDWRFCSEAVWQRQIPYMQ